MKLNTGEDSFESLYAEYRKKTKILMWIGFIVFHIMVLIASFIRSLINEPSMFLMVLFFVFLLAGLFIFLNGCASYAKLKGYSRWWGMLGLVVTPLIAILVLLFLPDRPDKYEVFMKDVIPDDTLKYRK